MAKHRKNIRKKASGFTLIELVLVIALLGILAAVALPLFFTASESSARNNARTAIVAAVNTGLAAYAAQQVSQGNGESYPSTLDSESPAATSGLDNPFFDNVLKSGVTTAGWTKVSNTCYTFDNGGTTEYFEYDTSGGSLDKVTSCT